MNVLTKVFEIYKRKFWSLEKQARAAGVTIGESTVVGSHFWGSEPYLIKIGSNCQITGGGKNLYTWRCWSSSQMVSPI